MSEPGEAMADGGAGGSGGAGSSGGAGGSGAEGGGGAEGAGSGGSLASPVRSKPAAEKPAPAPLINATGSPGLIAVAAVINSKFEPLAKFAQVDLGPNVETVQGIALAVQGIKGLLDVGGIVTDLIDTGFATLTAPIAALFPALPAITLGGLHVGLPHTHTHPPSLIPPAPPIPLPSLGMVMAPGAINVLLGGMPAARCGDVGMAVTCGSLAPPFVIATGSSNVFFGGRRAARIGDLTKHCQISTDATEMPSLKSVALGMVTGGALAGLAGGDVTIGVYAAVQAAAEAAALAIKAMIGKDPGLPALPGALVGPPVTNVLIGGFPCPGIGEFATAKLGGFLKKLVKGLGKKLKPASDGDDASQRENNGDTCNATHPVYLITGENFDSFVDYAPGTLFEWRRHYTSARGKRGSPLGHGWRHFYQRTLQRRLHRATFTNWDGLVTEFGRFELGEDTTRADGYVLVRLGLGHFRITRRGQPDLEFRGGEFDNQVPLVRVSSPKGRLDLEYDALGRLVALVETPKDEDVERRLFVLRYDERGHISHLLELDPRASHVEDGKAGAPQGMQRAAYTYSPARDLVLALDSLGGRWTYRYDAFHRLTEQSDARGYRYEYGYDASGRCTSASGQDGLWWARMEYFPTQRFTRCTEGEGATWEYHYDSEGVATQIVDPFGGVRQRRVDGLGRMSIETDSGGRTLEWLYDADGAHYARVDRFGNLFPPEREQPRLSNPFARTLPSTSLGWLFSGRAQPSADAMLGIDPAELAAFPPEVQNQAYGCFRLRQSAEPPLVPPARPSIEHDRLGRKVREEDALGRKREWRYDPTGNLVASIDRDGRQISQETTSWNLLGTRTDPLGNGVRYEYSKLEQVTAIIDPLGNESRYEYDLKQRLVRVHRHGALREEYIYDAGDHFIEKRNGHGNVLFTNTIHANHFVETRKLASGGEHHFDYDERGRIISASTEAHDILLAYASSGRRRRDLCDGIGVEHAHTGTRATTTRLFARFEHAARFDDGATQLLHADGATTRVEHANAGLIKRRLSNGSTEVLQFNEAGQLEASFRYRRGRFGPYEARSARYAYSPEGDLLQVDDSERGTTLYDVDSAHRLLAEHTPDGRDLYYAQDPAGNLVTHPATSRITLTSGNRLLATSRETLSYDARNHLAERTHYLGLAREPAATRYHYDSFDQLIRIERQEPKLPLWLLRLENPGAPLLPPEPNPVTDWQTWRAEYDALGRRLLTRWTTSDGVEKTRRFYWDGDRLAAEISPDGPLRIYEYASLEALVPLAFTDYPTLEAPLSSGHTYHLFVNPVGIPLSIEDRDGNSVWYAQRIDPYGQVDLRPGAKLEYNLRWPGHYFDPETGLHYNRYRYYDPTLGRYLQSDPIGHKGSPVNLYAYCPNPLVQVDVLGLDHPDKADGSDGANKPGDVDGQEGVPAKGGTGATSPAHHALAAAPNAGHDGRPTAAQLAARKRVAAEFIREHGQRYDRDAGRVVPLDRDGRKSQAKATDYDHPVVVGPPPAIPSQLSQWQAPGGSRGSYFAPAGTSPGELGIGDYGRAWSEPGAPVAKKQVVNYTMNDPNQPYMKSTSAPIDDKWSVQEVGNSPAMVQPTPGGGTQYTAYDGCDPTYKGVSP